MRMSFGVVAGLIVLASVKNVNAGRWSPARSEAGVKAMVDARKALTKTTQPRNRRQASASAVLANARKSSALTVGDRIGFAKTSMRIRFAAKTGSQERRRQHLLETASWVGRGGLMAPALSQIFVEPHVGENIFFDGQPGASNVTWSMAHFGAALTTAKVVSTLRTRDSREAN